MYAWLLRVYVLGDIPHKNQICYGGYGVEYMTYKPVRENEFPPLFT